MTSLHKCCSTCYEIYPFNNHFDPFFEDLTDTKVCPFCHSRSNNANSCKIQTSKGMCSQNFYGRCSKSSLSPSIGPLESYCTSRSNNANSCKNQTSKGMCSQNYCTRCSNSSLSPSIASLESYCTSRRNNPNSCKIQTFEGICSQNLCTCCSKSSLSPPIAPSENYCSSICDTCSRHSCSDFSNWKCGKCGWSRIEEYPSETCCCCRCNRRKRCRSADYSHIDFRTWGGKCRRCQSKFQSQCTGNVLAKKCVGKKIGNMDGKSQYVDKMGGRRTKSCKMKNLCHDIFLSAEQPPDSTVHFEKSGSKDKSLEKPKKKHSKGSKGKGESLKKVHLKTPTAYDKGGQKQSPSEKKGSKIFSTKTKRKRKIKQADSWYKNKQRLKSKDTKILKKGVLTDKGSRPQTAKPKSMGKSVSNERMKSKDIPTVSAKTRKERKLDSAKPRKESKLDSTKSRKESKLEKHEHKKSSKKKTLAQRIKDAAIGLKDSSRKLLMVSSQHVSKPKDTNKQNILKNPKHSKKTDEKKDKKISTQKVAVEKKPEKKPKIKRDLIFQKIRINPKHIDVGTEDKKKKQDSNLKIDSDKHVMKMPKGSSDKSIDAKEKSLKSKEKSPSAKELHNSKSKKPPKKISPEKTMHSSVESVKEKQISEPPSDKKPPKKISPAKTMHSSVESVKEKQISEPPSDKSIKSLKSIKSIESREKSRKSEEKRPSIKSLRSSKSKEDSETTSLERVIHSAVKNENINETVDNIMEDIIKEEVSHEVKTRKCTCSRVKQKSNVEGDNVSFTELQPTKPKCTCGCLKCKQTKGDKSLTKQQAEIAEITSQPLAKSDDKVELQPSLLKTKPKCTCSSAKQPMKPKCTCATSKYKQHKGDTSLTKLQAALAEITSQPLAKSDDKMELQPSLLKTKPKCTCSSAKHKNNVEGDNVPELQPTKQQCTCCASKQNAEVNVPEDQISHADSISTEPRSSKLTFIQKIKNTLVELVPSLMPISRGSIPNEKCQSNENTLQPEESQDFKSLESSSGDIPVNQTISEKSSNNIDNVQTSSYINNLEGVNVSDTIFSNNSNYPSRICFTFAEEPKPTKPKCLCKSAKNKGNVEQDTVSLTSILKNSNHSSDVGLQSTKPKCTCSASKNKQQKGETSLTKLEAEIAEITSQPLAKSDDKMQQTKPKCTCSSAKHKNNVEGDNVPEIQPTKPKCTCKSAKNKGNEEQDTVSLTSILKNSNHSSDVGLQSTKPKCTCAGSKNKRHKGDTSLTKLQAVLAEITTQPLAKSDDKMELQPSLLKTKPKCTCPSAKHKNNVEGDNVPEIQPTKPKCTCCVSKYKQHKEDNAENTIQPLIKSDDKMPLQPPPTKPKPKCTCPAAKYKNNFEGDNVPELQPIKPKCACGTSKQRDGEITADIMESTTQHLIKSDDNKPEECSFKKDSEKKSNNDIVPSIKIKPKCTCSAKKSLPLKEISSEHKITEKESVEPILLNQTKIHSIFLDSSTSTSGSVIKSGSKNELVADQYTMSKVFSHPVKECLSNDKKVKNQDDIPPTQSKIAYPVITSTFCPIQKANCDKYDISGSPLEKLVESESGSFLAKRRLEAKIIKILAEDEESAGSLNEELKVIYLNKISPQRCSKENLHSKTLSEISNGSSLDEKYSKKNNSRFSQYTRKVFNNEPSSSGCSSETLRDRSSCIFESLKESLIKEIAINLKMLQKISQSDMSETSEQKLLPKLFKANRNKSQLSSTEDFWSARSSSSGGCHSSEREY